MAEKLERKVMEIYGENAATRDIIAYGSDISGNIVETKDPDVIQTEAYKTGVRSAVVGNNSTTLQNRQALDFLFSRQLKYLFQKGIPEWKDTEKYYTGSFVSDGNGKIYFSKVDGNIGNDLEDKTKWKEFTPGGGGLPIGAVYYSGFSTSTQNPGALPLFTGETISNAEEIYPEFYAAILADTDLQCTAEEYEAALTKYGECAKYVIGGGSLRLPLIKNYIKAANPSEGIKNIEAGLPNIDSDTNWVNVTSGTETAATNTNNLSKKGVFGGTNSTGGHGIDGNNYPINWRRFDASLSNPIYGKSSTVTPASTTLYPWVVAYTAAIPASTAQAAEFQQGLSGKADANLGNVPSNYDYVVESQVNADGSWYRKYKSGWLEQGGFVNVANATVTFPKPFSGAPATLLLCSANTASAYTEKPTNITNTSFVLWQYQGYYEPCYWYACGQGA